MAQHPLAYDRAPLYSERSRAQQQRMHCRVIMEMESNEIVSFCQGRVVDAHMFLVYV